MIVFLEIMLDEPVKFYNSLPFIPSRQGRGKWIFFARPSDLHRTEFESFA
jgi:hypothetical protein